MANSRLQDYDLTTQPGRTHLYYDDRSVAKLGAPQFWFGFGLGYVQMSECLAMVVFILLGRGGSSGFSSPVLLVSRCTACPG